MDVSVVGNSSFSGFEVLIGMNIIVLGSFVISNNNDKTTFSFIMPSNERIDFVPLSEELNIKKSGLNRKQRRLENSKKRK